MGTQLSIPASYNGRVLLVSDIHGKCAAFKNLLSASGFGKGDTLIINGDVPDRGKNSKPLVDELIKIKNKIFVLGNHDRSFIDAYKHQVFDITWVLKNGGMETLVSYGFAGTNSLKLTIPKSHEEFFESAEPYLEISYSYKPKKYLVVHGGFDPKKEISSQSIDILTESRNLIDYALKGNIIPNYDMVYVGHCPVQNIEKDAKTPLQFQNLILCDGGAGFGRYLFMVDVLNPNYFWAQKAMD